MPQGDGADHDRRAVGHRAPLRRAAALLWPVMDEANLPARSARPGCRDGPRAMTRPRTRSAPGWPCSGCSAMWPSARRWSWWPRTRIGSTSRPARFWRSSRGGSRPTDRDADHLARVDPAQPARARCPSRQLAPLPADAAEALLYALDPRLPAGTRKRILAQAQGNPLGLVELLAGAARRQSSISRWPAAEHAAGADVRGAGRGSAVEHADRAAGRRADRSRGRDRGARGRGRVCGEPSAWRCSRRRSPPGWSRSTSSGALRASADAHRDRPGRSGDPAPRGARGAGRDARGRSGACDLAPRGGVLRAPTTSSRTSYRRRARAPCAAARSSPRRETLGRAAALTGDEAARGARLLDAAELALDIGRDDLVEQLLDRRGAAGARGGRPAAPALAAADRAPARARPRAGSRPTWTASTSSSDPRRASQALLTIAFRAWWSDVPAPLRDRMVAHARALPPGRRVIAMVALSLVGAGGARAGGRGTGSDGWSSTSCRASCCALAAVACPVVGAFDRGDGDLRPRDRAAARPRPLRAVGNRAGRPRLDRRARGCVERVAGRRAGGDASSRRRPSSRCGWWRRSRPRRRSPGCAATSTRALALADEARGGAAARRGRRDALDGRVARGLAPVARRRPAAALAHLQRVLDPASRATRASSRAGSVADAVEAAVLRQRPRGRAARCSSARRRSRSRRAHLDGVDRVRAGCCSRPMPRPMRSPRPRSPPAVELPGAAGARRSSPTARTCAGGGARPRRGRCCGPRATPSRRSTSRPGAERARGELRAAGEAVRTAAVDPATVLTPQELQIARMAAEGLSNREIGQALYLSHRTIGSHLYRVFPKLGDRVARRAARVPSLSSRGARARRRCPRAS